MSTGVVVAIVVAALILIALVALLARRGREQRLDARRTEAGRLRDEAGVRRRNAEREQAESDQIAAQAKKARAMAEEKAAEGRRAEADAEASQIHARHEHAEAQRHREQALEIDPDADAADEARPDVAAGQPEAGRRSARDEGEEAQAGGAGAVSGEDRALRRG
jgi:biopolymer transport protein ExbB/TolQ